MKCFKKVKISIFYRTKNMFHRKTNKDNYVRVLRKENSFLSARPVCSVNTACRFRPFLDFLKIRIFSLRVCKETREASSKYFSRGVNHFCKYTYSVNFLKRVYFIQIYRSGKIYGIEILFLAHVICNKALWLNISHLI